MSVWQKVGRVFLFTTTVVVLCILLSMLAAATIFTTQHARRAIDNTPEFMNAIGIILVSMLVNTLCVMGLLAIRRADHKLVPPAAHTAPAEGKQG